MNILNMEAEKDGVIAWLLQVDRHTIVAVGQYELIHIVDKPDYIPIPQAPEYCRHVIIWNDNIVPVVNLEAWDSGSLQTCSSAAVAILVYKDSQDDFSYGGVKLDHTPTQQRVRNEQFSQLTIEQEKWRKISLSCFKTNAGKLVPILDVYTLFAKRFDN